MRMKKLLFAMVAVLLSVISFAEPVPNMVQDGPICPQNAPCYYTGGVQPYSNHTLQRLQSACSIKIKVVKVNGDYVAVITQSDSGRLNGESAYVYSDKRDGYTHYFILGDLRYYFKM